jgi:hypothetical protein
MAGAVALSNITIFGGALANAAFNVGARHPLKPGPLIDWDLALVMEPSTILGALAGTYINHVSGVCQRAGQAQHSAALALRRGAPCCTPHPPHQPPMARSYPARRKSTSRPAMHARAAAKPARALEQGGG